MSNIPNTLNDFESIKGKAVTLKVSGRLMKRSRMHIDGMSFRVIGTTAMNEVFLEPLIPKFKDELQLLPINLYGIEWDVIMVFDNPELLTGGKEND